MIRVRGRRARLQETFDAVLDWVLDVETGQAETTPELRAHAEGVLVGMATVSPRLAKVRGGRRRPG